MTETIDDQAAHWLAAQDGDDVDWSGFTAWLEADPRHRAAFDAIALLDDDIFAQRAAIVGEQARAKSTTGSRGYLGWVAAASGIAAIALATISPPRIALDRTWSTGVSARTVLLTNGSRVVLAPRTRLAAKFGDQARLTLSGAAFFDIPHRPGRMLTIDAGGFTVRDIGTRFAVTADAASTRVSVAEGTVTVSAAALDTPVRLSGGRGMTARGRTVALAPIADDAVASWRRGTLLYDQTPLALVAEDIARYGGTPVVVDSRLADRRFSGALTIGDGAKLAGSVAAILGIEAHREDGHLLLEPRR